ncbi:MAG: tetratricopeptide repeat protein [Rhodobacteraceae bacterium]|nr:tetratricopeptide repeat protein [Paracoccaceae bacterium]
MRPADAAALTGLCLVLLTACGPDGRLSGATVGDSPFAPSRLGNADDAVDGLIVGHRLMAAGEYELALRAYYRAAGEQGLTADVLSAIGSANLRLGRLGQAERILRQAIAKDERFVPAWNNLGVTLMEAGKVAEARNVFQTAYALDSGNSDEIRDNLRLAIAKVERPRYDAPQEQKSTFQLVRRGNGRFLLLSTPP